jgi:predicted DNA-binding transcriptional regulator YafY
MSLFSEKKNRYFGCCQKLINQAVAQNGLTLNEIKETIKQEGFYEYDHEFIQGLIGNANDVFSDIQLLYESKGKYYPVINKEVPVVISALEKQWLRCMLDQNGVDAFLHSALVNRLKKELVNISGNSELAPLFFDSDSCIDDVVRKNLKLIIEALQENSYLTFDNHTLSGEVYSKSRIIPYKVEFSAKLKGFWLIGYEMTVQKMIKVALSRIEILSKNPRNDNIDLEKLSKQLYKREKIRLEIVDVKGALERALHVFSEYKRDSFFDRERNIHVVEIDYNKFDEYDIEKTLFSLGTYVKVIFPEQIRWRMYEAITKQIKMLS